MGLLQEGPLAPPLALERAVSASDYRLGPGDRLTINIWRTGKPSNGFDIVVPPEGKVFLPVVGDVSVKGLTIDQFKQELTHLVTTRIPGFQVSLLLTALRSFRVLVVGEVSKPGYVTATAVTRLSQVISAACLSPLGSVRSIQLRRAKGPGLTVDLYQFLVQERLEANPLINDGDVIAVPQWFGLVRMDGAVGRPGVYEIRQGETLRNVFVFSGGLLPDADLERVQLERIMDGQKVVLAVNLARLLLEGDEAQDLRLQFDDVVFVPSMLALAKVVFVDGRVARPGGYAWRENETVSTLLVRAGGVVLQATPPEGSQDPSLTVAPADLTAAYVERAGVDGRKLRLPIDLQRLLVDRDLVADAKLQPGDVLVVPSRIQQVFVHGFVERPGAFAYEPNRMVKHYIGLASPKPTADLQKVAVRHLDGALTGGLDTPIQPGDTILVPEKQVMAVLQILGIIAPIISLILGR